MFTAQRKTPSLSFNRVSGNSIGHKSEALFFARPRRRGPGQARLALL